MKKLPSLLLLAASIFVIAAAGACLSLALCAKMRGHSSQTERVWTQLDLTPEQKTALESVESRYREKRRQLEQELREANDALAEAILADGRDSKNVHAAIERIHARMGALQELTINHVFEMRTALSPEQYDRLLRLTADALRNVDTGTENDAAR